MIDYHFPLLKLLRRPCNTGSANKVEIQNEEIKKMQSLLQSFSIDARMTSVCFGENTSFYEIEPGSRTRIRQITRLKNEIKLFLQADEVDFEIPVPGTNHIGIIVFQHERKPILLRNIFILLERFKSLMEKYQ
jgi:S-DNA-T family DNA segregation ATPase FtsK/SpoIIIE